MEKYIGLDLGTKTLGIAVSDELGIVYPKENFTFEKGNYKKARLHLLVLISNLKISNIVIGYPLQLDRNEGERCKSVKRFINDLLKENSNINVTYYDESFTTIEAKERLLSQGVKENKIKEIIDMMSAVVILEDYLRSKENGIKK